jgi:hypothetical protein
MKTLFPEVPLNHPLNQGNIDNIYVNKSSQTAGILIGVYPNIMMYPNGMMIVKSPEISGGNRRLR